MVMVMVVMMMMMMMMIMLMMLMLMLMIRVYQMLYQMRVTEFWRFLGFLLGRRFPSSHQSLRSHLGKKITEAGHGQEGKI